MTFSRLQISFNLSYPYVEFYQNSLIVSCHSCQCSTSDNLKRLKPSVVTRAGQHRGAGRGRRCLRCCQAAATLHRTRGGSLTGLCKQRSNVSHDHTSGRVQFWTWTWLFPKGKAGEQDAHSAWRGTKAPCSPRAGLVAELEGDLGKGPQCGRNSNWGPGRGQEGIGLEQSSVRFVNRELRHAAL